MLVTTVRVSSASGLGSPVKSRILRRVFKSLYEAVLRGLNRLQDVGWECNGNETIPRVEVQIHQQPTRHIVDVPKLLKRVQEDSMYPAQQTRKERLRKLLSTQ